LESDEEVEYIQCPKLDSPFCKTGYSGFDRTDGYEGIRENLRSWDE
jgi:hypothetical protein